MRLSTLRTQHSDCEDAGSIPGLIQWVKDPALLQAVAWVTDTAPVLCCYGCGVGHRLNSDPALLWLLCRLAAVAQIQPLAWELPCAAGVALKRKGKKKKSQHFNILDSQDWAPCLVTSLCATVSFRYMCEHTAEVQTQR